MSVPIKLSIDRQNRRLVNYAGGITSFPPLYQSNVQDFEITIVDPDPSGKLASYVAVDMNGIGLRVAVGPTPTGTAGGPTVPALELSWTWVPASKKYTGALQLNTTPVDNLIGALPSALAYFEVNTTTSSGRVTVLQTQFTLYAVLDELTTTAPTVTDQYFTKAEMLNLFVKKVGLPGERILLKDENGVYARELGVDSNGAFTSDSVIL
jgi:hypothetical protein